MYKPCISICIPVYNTERYLDICLKSISCQTFNDFEVLCVDDGSTDLSYSILTKHALNDPRIRIIRTQNNGQSIARNLMLKEAKGRYIYFVDSDDYLSKDALQKMMTVASAYNLDILRVCLDPFTIDSDFSLRTRQAKDYYKLNESYNNTYTGIELISIQVRNKDYCSSTACYFFRNGFIKENNICFPTINKYEDNDFNYRLLVLAERVRVIPDQIYHRQYRKNSLMTKEKTYCDVISLLSCYSLMLNFARENNIASHKDIHLFYPLAQLKKIAIGVFNKLNEHEKNKVIESTALDIEAFYCDFLSMTSTSTTKKRNSIARALVKSLSAIKFELRKKLGLQ